jgi:gliding motility-associated-like protein
MKTYLFILLSFLFLTNTKAQEDPTDDEETSEAIALEIEITSVKPISCPLTDNGSVSLSAINGAKPYEYLLDGVLLSSNGYFGNLSAGKHNVFVTDSLGLSVSFDFITTRSYTTIAEDCPCSMFIPTALTANADGVNDLFNIVPSCPVVDFELRIYDRWGNLVFESFDYKEKWNGASDKYHVPNGIYNYTISYRWGELLDTSINVQSEKGFVQVLR